MTIDCTLFVQMINFFLAYLIMRFLLFKPVVAIIDADNDERERGNEAVKSFEVSLKLVLQERAELWQAFHQSVTSEIGVISDEDAEHTDINASMELEGLTHEQQDELVDACSKWVIEKVTYVRK